LLLIVTNASAQKTSQKTKSKKTEQKVQPKEEMPPEGVMDTTIIVTSEPVEHLPPPPPPMVVAKIDFDTSASPEDDFTALIRKLLTVTKAKEMDIENAEKSLRQSIGPALYNPNTTAITHKFLDRFMFEMREGRASRWLENLYIRNYRALFTPAEIQSLIEFYETPLGQKTLQRTKILLQNVMGEGMKIGAYLGADLMTKIMEEDKQ